jgi:hypothetical protein
VLVSPSLPFGRIEDTVVVRVHLLELRGRPPRRTLFSTLDVLLTGEAAAGQRACRPPGSWFRRSRCLLICLG